MLFCQFYKSESIREISNGLRSATGNSNHLVLRKKNITFGLLLRTASTIISLWEISFALEIIQKMKYFIDYKLKICVLKQ
jgi:hypothetical protein